MAEQETNHLMNELMQGRELADQLRLHFHHHHHPSSSSSSSAASNQSWELLIFRILLSYDKALSMLDSVGSTPLGKSLSPSSPGESPMNGDSDRDNKEHEVNNNKKIGHNPRKAMQRWTKRVKISHGNGIEGQLDDGHNWRKYGQKDILGAKYPRGYYRCTHRDSLGCLSTKQVQRSDEDPTSFDITYRGMHTCNHSSVRTDPSSSMPENEGPNNASVIVVEPQQQHHHKHQPSDLEQQKDHDELLDFYKILAIITDDSSRDPFTAFSLSSISLDSHHLPPLFDAFNFPDTVSGYDLFCENQSFHSLDNYDLGVIVSAASGVATSSGTNSRVTNSRGSLADLFNNPIEVDNSFGNPEFFSE